MMALVWTAHMELKLMDASIGHLLREHSGRADGREIQECSCGNSRRLPVQESVNVEE